ncbi:YggT family protein [Bartonella phoceensis]|uniref:YggT family protein n=1 Tax=Bartonella phoceensis TaxID=270249 RepID=UPI001ABA722B|nr:YggT family protein [Bartonella phoceensis]
MIYTLLKVIDFIFDVYTYVLIARVIVSWLYVFNIINTRNRFVALIGNFLYRLTEPVLGRIRQSLPNLGTLDISPVIAFIVIYFTRVFMWYAYTNIYL